MDVTGTLPVPTRIQQPQLSLAGSFYAILCALIMQHFHDFHEQLSHRSHFLFSEHSVGLGRRLASHLLRHATQGDEALFSEDLSNRGVVIVNKVAVWHDEVDY